MDPALWLPGGYSKWEAPVGDLEGGRRVKLRRVSPAFLSVRSPQGDCVPLLKSPRSCEAALSTQ